jgi:hypothetical protein
MPLPLIAAIGIGAAAAGGIAQTISGISRTNKAKKALAGFQRQRLTNITEGMRVSTMGAELQTQEAQRRFATSVDALRSGGVRGLVGGLGQVEQQQQIGQQQIAAGLDQQQQQIDMMRAEDEGRIRSMIENRESAAIAGLGAELQNARQTTNAGISGIAGAGLAAFTAGADLGSTADIGKVGKVVKGIKDGSSMLNSISNLTQDQAAIAANRLNRAGTFDAQNAAIQQRNMFSSSFSSPSFSTMNPVSFAPKLATINELNQ